MEKKPMVSAVTTPTVVRVAGSRLRSLVRKDCGLLTAASAVALAVKDKREVMVLGFLSAFCTGVRYDWRVCVVLYESMAVCFQASAGGLTEETCRGPGQ